MQLFGTSGIRRKVDRELVELALRVGWAVGTVYDNIVVGRDTRTSASALRHAVMAGLLTAGARCSDAGVLPTPTLAFVAREFKAGMMITASHNPPEYNGIKILNPDGSSFSAVQQQEIEDLLNGLAPLSFDWSKMGNGEVYSAAPEKHIGRILQDFTQKLNIRVAVDCGGGAAYGITPRLLTRLGCEVIPLYCYPEGIFPHDIEPNEENLGELMLKVKESGAALGIAHDGDADRMMAIDDLGRFISGDKLMAILAREVGVKRLVTTVDASMSIDEMGFTVKRTRVGDPHVSSELKKGGEFGGEPSGAWVFPSISLCPDGIYAAARIASIASRHKLSMLADSIPAYPLLRGSLAAADVNMLLLQHKLQAEFKPLSWDTIDGIKLNLREGWLLVRPSGTEPKIRLTVEAKTTLLAHQIYDDLVRILKEYLEEQKR